MKKGIKGKGKGKIAPIALSLAMVFMMACTENEFREQDFTSLSYQVQVGQVDILFVVDTSGSMSAEQRKMAEAFDNFLQGLNIAGVDYRLGIITMDVESKANPLKDFGQGKGALQNGNLLEFPDGSYYLTPQSNDIEDQFWSTIQREETLDCERGGYVLKDCPSDDERGIYSAFLTVNSNKQNFFRKNGHVAFIFLTDEDVRGHGLGALQSPYFKPEAYDYPVNLIQIVKTRIGANTTMSAHAIITDSDSCLDQQSIQGGNPNIDGKIGSFYRTLTNPNNYSLANPDRRLDYYANGMLVEGVVGSICASSYTSQVGDIASVITQKKSEEKFGCVLEREDSLNVRISQDYEWELNENKDGITFTPALPAGQSFVIEYDCYQ